MTTDPRRRPPLRGHRLWSGLSVLSKRSLRSFTTASFEADDEYSSTDGTDMPSSLSSHSDGNHDDDGRRNGGGMHRRRRRNGRPTYSGHDARPTSRKELTGWYMYAFAAETYMICGIGSFIPILLETLARENGVQLNDPSKPCGTSDSKDRTEDGQCVVNVLGIQVNTASFAMYTFSVSVLLQAVLVVSISCAADHGNYRKKLLLGFAWLGSLSVMAYIFISKEVYLLGSVLTIISNVSFGASFVLLNSFLPLLVRYHPDVIHVNAPGTPDLAGSDLESRHMEDSTGELEPSMVSSTSALLSDAALAPTDPVKKGAAPEVITSKELQLSTQMSGRGIGVGYSAGLFLQCVSIGILIAMHNSTWSLRVVLFLTGLWWTVFTVPAAMWLRPRPGPPLTQRGRKGHFAAVAYLIYAWKSLFTTMKLAWRLRDIMLFLAGWFLLSDAIATTSSTAILFAKTTLHMQPWALGMVNVITTLCGVIGAFGWSSASRALGLQPHQTILACIALFELIPIYGLMGYLPFVQRWGTLGLQQPWEMYPLAGVYGLVLGGLSSYCRSLYGELIPPGSEAAFYALYAITDKGSSVFGPTIVGAIIDKSGSIRPAFWFLAALVGCPAPLIYLIKVDRGKREGAKLAEMIEGFRDEEEGDDMLDEEEARGMMGDYDDEGEDEEAEGGGDHRSNSRR